MKNDSAQSRIELVRSLGSTIHKKVVAPPAGKIDTIGAGINEINHKLAGLETELSHLAIACRRARLAALVAALGVAVLVAIEVIRLFLS
ncbi:MAG: hypothetical protein PHS52_05990 [Desulfotomaculaceae bacterium]|nr:hypothetical protein [Desulfotomaculaceae bacterium]